jgi:hypothetical protein
VVLDWYSRYVLSWRLSNNLDGDFCLQALGFGGRGSGDAIRNYSRLCVGGPGASLGFEQDHRGPSPLGRAQR